MSFTPPAFESTPCRTTFFALARLNNMTSDDRKPPTPLATDDLALSPTEPSQALAVPETLAEGLRYLQQRIPGFAHLSTQEKRSRGRAANLDPEFIEAGLHAATVWRETKHFVGRSGEALREEQEDIRRWDQVVVELRAITNGIEGANTKRKHELGNAILTIYAILGRLLKHPVHYEYVRPYYDDMKRAFLRTQAFRRKKKPQEDE